jgi:hypothetical protein
MHLRSYRHCTCRSASVSKDLGNAAPAPKSTQSFGRRTVAIWQTHASDKTACRWLWSSAANTLHDSVKHIVDTTTVPPRHNPVPMTSIYDRLSSPEPTQRGTRTCFRKMTICGSSRPPKNTKWSSASRLMALMGCLALLAVLVGPGDRCDRHTRTSANGPNAPEAIRGTIINGETHARGNGFVTRFDHHHTRGTEPLRAGLRALTSASAESAWPRPETTTGEPESRSMTSDPAPVSHPESPRLTLTRR